MPLFIFLVAVGLIFGFIKWYLKKTKKTLSKHRWLFLSAYIISWKMFINENYWIIYSYHFIFMGITLHKSICFDCARLHIIMLHMVCMWMQRINWKTKCNEYTRYKNLNKKKTNAWHTNANKHLSPSSYHIILQIL